jgi:DinB family protein
MSSQMATREALLDGQTAARESEAALYAAVVDEPVPPDGAYRVKDHIAHLAAWRRRAADVLRGAGEGIQDVDAWNARVYERTRDLPAEQVVREARDSWTELITAVEDLSEEELHGPHPFNPDLELWVVVYANGDKHFDEHAGYIAELGAS